MYDTINVHLDDTEMALFGGKHWSRCPKNMSNIFSQANITKWREFGSFAQFKEIKQFQKCHWCRLNSQIKFSYYNSTNTIYVLNFWNSKCHETERPPEWIILMALRLKTWKWHRYWEKSETERHTKNSKNCVKRWMNHARMKIKITFIKKSTKFCFN